MKSILLAKFCESAPGILAPPRTVQKWSKILGDPKIINEKSRFGT
jgi:hypothetical protein